MPDGSNASGLLQAWGRGDLSARDRFIPLVYRELQRRAAAYLRREPADHTLQPTALVHEVFLRFAEQDQPVWKNRSQSPPDVSVLDVDDALTELGLIDPRKGRIAELRFFGGLTIQESSDVLGISPATIEREWQGARAWLYARLTKGTKRVDT